MKNRSSTILSGLLAALKKKPFIQVAAPLCALTLLVGQALAVRPPPPHPVTTEFFDCRASESTCEQEAYDNTEENDLGSWNWKITWSDGSVTWGGYEFD